MTNTSQKSRLLTAFRSGRDFTTRQISDRIGVSESRARYLVTELRQEGNAIYRNRKTFAYGDRANVYRLGSPSQAMVAFAAVVGGSQLFA
jgi:predicted ArsR family transcriptional regulator